MQTIEAFGDGHGNVPIRPAACLVLIDRCDDEARVLMGRRLATQVFLPNKWVFPGGRVDDGDVARAAQVGANPPGHTPFVLAAVREMYEEAGLDVAGGIDHRAANAADARIHPLARAITPPGLPRRFDTWFYAAEWDRSRGLTGTPDGELLDLGWFTLAEVEKLDLPTITRLIVDDVARLVSAPDAGRDALIPFYYQAEQAFTRRLISPNWPWPEP